MFKTILAFIKAHTIATAITTTVVVSTVVATPIIINQAQKPKQEIETGQVQENIIDNTVIDNTVEEETETPEENITDENTTVPEEEQKVETPKEENKQDQNKNQGTTKPTTPSSSTPTSNNNKTETPNTQETKGTWVTYHLINTEPDYLTYQYNSTTKKYRIVYYGGGYSTEFTKSQALSFPDIASLIKECKSTISSSQEDINSIHNRYEVYRAEAQKNIDYRQRIIDNYKNSVIANGGDFESETVKATLAEYNRDLQKAIDYKASYDTLEKEESSLSKQRLQTAQSRLNAILAQFQ